MKYPLNTFSEETQKEIMVLIEQAYKQGVSDVVLEKEETDVANSEHDEGFISGCNLMIDRLEELKAKLHLITPLQLGAFLEVDKFRRKEKYGV